MTKFKSASFAISSWQPFFQILYSNKFLSHIGTHIRPEVIHRTAEARTQVTKARAMAK